MVNWTAVLLGAGIIAVGTITPIPDDIATFPIGTAIILYGLGDEL